MKRFHVACLAGLIAASTTFAADPELKTDDDKTLYALGLVISNQLSVFHLSPTELDVVKAGLSDGLLKKTPKVDIEAFGPKIKPMADARMAAGVGEEKKKGKAFLETVMAKPGIKKTGSGLLMETVKEGTGKSPVPTDSVKVNYKGTFIDGSEFDSNTKSGIPATFSLDRVIPCWVEALEFMKVGGKAKVYCPSDIAYGDKGRPGIPPGATLLFDLELLEIVAK
jgi:FKBP-type peptidyl-prolyl cis-trans isomerase FkpA